MPELATSRTPVAPTPGDMAPSRYCTFSALADTSSPATLRTATLEGSDYICIPVIALIGNAIVRPLGSTALEFVPASELAQLPQQWNSRPVVLNHPGDGSACRPEVLEASRFGHIFNAKYEDGKLKLEAWLSREKASKVGPDAERLIELCESGGMVEVSIGAWVTISHSPGTYNNQPYTYVWSDIVSDHIAFLSEGSLGACSNSMGCGAPRLMQAREGESTMPEDITKRADKPPNTPNTPNLFSRFLSALGGIFRSQEMSNEELREKLSSALISSEVGFDWIVRIWPESKVIIYTTYIPGESGSVFYWKRSYNIQQEGTVETVSLGDDRQQVEPPDGNDLEDWKEIRAAAGAETIVEETKKETSDTPAPAVMRAACECEKDKKQDTNSNNEKGDLTMAENAAPKTDTPKTDAPAPPSTTTTPTTATPAPAALEPAKGEEKKEVNAGANNVVTIPAEEYAEIRAAAAAYTRQQAEHKGALVQQLKAAQTGFNEDDLKTFNVEQLEKLGKALGVNKPVYDYSGVGLPVKILSEEEKKQQDVYLNPPDPYDIKGLQESRKARNNKGVM